MKKVLIFVTVAMLVLILATSYLPLGRTIHNRVANRVMHKTAKQIEQQHRVRLCGKGYQMFGGPIRNLKLSFNVCRPLSKQEGRILITECLDTFLETVRNDPNGEAAFQKWPPDYNTVSAALYISQSDGSDVAYPLPAIVSAYKGTIWYMYYDGNRPPPNNWRQKDDEETIEEAIAIIQQEANSVPFKQLSANNDE